MSHKNSILNQIIQIVPRHEFEKSVKKYNGDFASKGFTCWEQFVSMLFAQLSGQTRLRGIETTLDSIKNMLYHLGVKKILINGINSMPVSTFMQDKCISASNLKYRR